MISEKIIKELSKFFDEVEEAEAILREHLTSSNEVFRDDTTHCSLQDFFTDHKAAYIRRATHKTAHSISILKLDLVGMPRGGGRYATRSEKPGLESYDKHRTEPIYVYRPKSRK